MRPLAKLHSRGVYRLAVVGSGPGGFYTAHHLMKKLPEVFVDIIEKLPVPFGLVRYGVAPDHPNVKNVTRKLSEIAKSEKCRFIGNVTVGKDVSIDDLKRYYSGIVLAHGSEEENYLNIPGEQLKGIYSSKKFISWYNGLPQHADLNPDLSGKTAVIIGQGNVAMDVARILLSPLDSLRGTDISTDAICALRKSNIERVILVGRRGPLQVSFTIKQLREMLALPDCEARLNFSDFAGFDNNLKDLSRPRKRITELLMQNAPRHYGADARKIAKSWELKFFCNPVQFLSSNDGYVRAIRLERSKMNENDEESIGIGEYEELDCSTVFRCIRFKNRPIDSRLPFDHHLGIIPNRLGRVVDTGGIVKGLYCSGWIRQGPKGSIVMTMNSAFDTAESIVEDICNGKLPKADFTNDVMDIVKGIGITFTDWERLNEHEKTQGNMRHKPRDKISSIEKMFEIMKCS